MSKADEETIAWPGNIRWKGPGDPMVGAMRTESGPALYRLVKRGNEYVLQGRFDWHDGVMSGHDWRDIPTVLEGET